MPEMINPNREVEMEMQKRGNNAQLAAQLISSMLQGRVPEGMTAVQIAKFALDIADEIRKYVTAPLPETSRLME